MPDVNNLQLQYFHFILTNTMLPTYLILLIDNQIFKKCFQIAADLKLSQIRTIILNSQSDLARKQYPLQKIYVDAT